MEVKETGDSGFFCISQEKKGFVIGGIEGTGEIDWEGRLRDSVIVPAYDVR